MKGLAAIVIEAVRAAERAGVASGSGAISSPSWKRPTPGCWNDCCVARAPTPSVASHEMEASAALLSSLGVDPVMTRATVEALRHAARHGVPEVPGQAKS